MNKKFLIFGICLFLSSTSVFASDLFFDIFPNNDAIDCSRETKCLDLITAMHDQRPALYNVLNLSSDQQVAKDTIDKKRFEEMGKYREQYEQELFVLSNMQKHGASKAALKKQEKVLKNLEKTLRKAAVKYDREFKSILDSEQKAKYNAVTQMKKKEIRYCRKKKAFYKRDPKLRPFGEKMYYTDTEKVLCPVHEKWHLFGFKHKVKTQTSN